MRRIAIILAVISSSYSNGIAQIAHSIHGTIRDTAGTALGKATVSLITEKDSLSSLSKEDGSFAFSDLNSGQIELRVSMKGFITVRKKIFITQTATSADIGAILLKIDYKQLDSVVIERVRPIIIGCDTISYQIAAFHVRDGSELEELLKSLPGVEVDMDGNVTVQGKQIARVRVDGKDFFGGNILAATRNLPADIIEKIQVIDDYGDKARITGIKSGDPSKILNIVLKDNKRIGHFGHAQIGGGTKNKYQESTFASMFKGDRQLSAEGSLENTTASGSNNIKNLSLNYSDRFKKKILVESNITTLFDGPATSGSLAQDNYYAIGHLHQEQNYVAKENNGGISWGSTITYIPNEHNTLRLNPSVLLQNSKQTLSSTFASLQQDSSSAKSILGNSSTVTSNNSIGYVTELYYENSAVRSKNRFSIQASTHYSTGRQLNDDFSNSLTKTSGANGQTIIRSSVGNKSASLNIAATPSYYISLSNSSFLELSYTWNISSNRDRRLTSQSNDSMSQLVRVDSLSNRFSFRSTTQRLHIAYIAQLKKINITLNMDGQPYTMQGTTSNKETLTSYRYFSVLPGAQANIFFTPHSTLSFQYSGSRDAPGLQQIQPVADNSNPQYPVIGNPQLKPSFSQSMILRYEHSAVKATQITNFGISLGYNNTSNTIIPNIIHPKDTTSIIQETTYVGLGGSYAYHGDYHVNLPYFFNKRLRIQINGSLVFSQAKGMADNIIYTTQNRNFTQGIHVQFVLPDVFESEIQGKYNAARTIYTSESNPPISFSSADWSLNNRHAFKKWILKYSFIQEFNRPASGGLQATRNALDISFQRQFLTKNRAIITLTGHDLLNNNTGISQSISTTNMVSSRTNLIGRYFMFSLIWKWGKFGE